MGSLTHKFAGIGAFAKFLDQRVEAMVPIGRLMVATSARMLKNAVKSGYGDRVLPELAESTMDERQRLGFSRDQPLLRDGSLLRDSTEEFVGENIAAAGTSEPIAGYHEFGYHNARTGTDVPPRRVYKLALEKVAPAVMRMMEANVKAQLGFDEAALTSDIETQTAIYALDVNENP